MSGVPESKGPEFWLIDGEPYDFKEFMYKHPGGHIWFMGNVRRDISILVHTYHKDPAKIYPMLAKYKMTGLSKEDIKPKVALPPFLLPPDFDAERDIPKFDFFKPNQLLDSVRKDLLKPEFQAKVRYMDQLFDTCCNITFGVYLLISLSLLFGLLPWYVTVPLMVALRTSLAGYGHYYIHQKKPNWGDVLFDINYVGTSLTAFDGHVMLHHTYTQSSADVKSAFFFSMLSLPTIWRIPGYTLHKLGNMILGNLARGLEIQFMERDVGIWHHSFWYMRALLAGEFFISLLTGTAGVWFLQYFFSLWFNTFLVLSSHEFEHYGSQAHGNDWGVFQVKNSYDMIILGNKWIDLFLSAGLSPHRAHHLLPYQRSGFANIISEPIIREHMKEFGIDWIPSKNFWIDRVPIIVEFVFNSPVIVPNTGELKYKRPDGFKHWLKEQVSLESIFEFVLYVAKGTIGVGAV